CASPHPSTTRSRAATCASRGASAGSSCRTAPPPMATPDPPDRLPPALRPGHPMLGLGYSEPVRRRSLMHLDGAEAVPGSAAIAEEVPVALVYNGRSHAVMM